MPRYVAFLRGVSPMNARMPDLKRCFEAAGFTDVRTLRSSGNIAFTAEPDTVPPLEARAEQAMSAGLGRSFDTIVRPVRFLEQMLAADPFGGFELHPDAKRVVTFLKRPHDGTVAMPLAMDDAILLRHEGTEVFAAYRPGERGPAFMRLLEKTFGRAITTRTVGTVRRCATA